MVLVEYPRRGLWAISAGIVTPSEDLYGAERLLAGRLSKSEVEARLYGEDDQARREEDQTP